MRLINAKTLSLLLATSLVLNLYLAYKWEFTREVLYMTNLTGDLVSASSKIKPGMSKTEVLSMIEQKPTSIKWIDNRAVYNWIPNNDPPLLYRLRFGTGGNGSYYLDVVFDENSKVLRVTADNF